MKSSRGHSKVMTERDTSIEMNSLEIENKDIKSSRSHSKAKTQNNTNIKGRKRTEVKSQGVTSCRDRRRVIIPAAVTSGLIIVIIAAISIDDTLRSYRKSKGEAD